VSGACLWSSHLFLSVLVLAGLEWVASVHAHVYRMMCKNAEVMRAARIETAALCASNSIFFFF
jgi:hypothetical protein